MKRQGRVGTFNDGTGGGGMKAEAPVPVDDKGSPLNCRSRVQGTQPEITPPPATVNHERLSKALRLKGSRRRAGLVHYPFDRIA